MKFITLDNLKTFLNEIKKYKTEGISEIPGKIEYWSYNISKSTLSKVKRLICDGSIVKISDYQDLYNVLKTTKTISGSDKYSLIKNFKSVKVGDYFNEDGKHKYYCEITNINFDDETVTYKDVAGYINKISFKKVLKYKTIHHGSSSCNYSSCASSCASSCGYDAGYDTYEYDWNSSDDFFKKAGTTTTINCGLYDANINGSGNIVKDGKEYSTTEYFQLPDLRETYIVGAGKNTTYNYSMHDAINVSKTKEDLLASGISIDNKRIGMIATITY